MPLDPAIAALIAATRGQTPVSCLTPDQARNRQPPFRADLMPFASAANTQDICVEHEGGRFSMRHYPHRQEGRAPLALYFHGGGFVVGSVDTHDAIARNLCGGARSAVLSVNYRLAPEAPFPAGVADAFASLLWALEHASDLRIDPEKVFLCGDSAGGTLATVSSILARDRGITIRGQMLAYPVTAHHSRGMPSYEAFASGYGLSREDMVWYWRQYVGGEDAPDDFRAAPLLHPDPGGVAPAFIATAEYDPLRDEGEAYARALAAAGVRVVMRRYEGVNHGFWARSATVGAAEQLYQDIFAWMSERLT